MKSWSQECGSNFDLKKLKHENSEQYREFLRIENLTNDYINRIKSNPNARLIDENGTIIIPIVFHILHRGEAVGTGTNLSDAVLIDQIDVLNECFMQMNDQTSIPLVFRNVAGNPNFRFLLACRNPNGNVTNGIVRRQTETERFIVEIGNAKQTVEGGDDPWPTDRYFNIWVCPNLFSSNNNTADGTMVRLLGASPLPSAFASQPQRDGISLRFDATGRGINKFPGKSGGRTIVHETGHWLNLLHLFDEGCNGNDFCNDTPLQKAGTPSTITCPGFPRNDNECLNTPNGDMFHNFMDGTDDICGVNMFTQDQVLRMRAVFQPGGARRGFIDNYFKLVHSGYRVCIEEFDLVTSPFCEAAGNINWSITGPALFGNPQGFSVYVNPYPNTNGEATLTASWNNFTSDLKIPVGYGVEGSLYSYSGNTFANTPIYSGGYYPAKSNTFGNVSFTGAIGAAQNWRVVSQTGSSYLYGSGNSFNVSLYPPNSNITVKADINTVCGLKNVQYTFYYSPYGYGGGYSIYTLSPNPASNSITIKAANTNPNPNARTGDVPEYEVKIFTRYNQLMKKAKCPKGTGEIQLDVNDLPSNQLYTARIVSGNDVQNISFFRE